MTGQDIITQFELQVNDITELSGVEELLLLNRVYHRICEDRPWEFLKTNGSGVLTLDPVTNLYYISLPDNFAFFIENQNYTDNAYAFPGTANPKAVFVGTNNDSYKIVNFSDRNQYRNQNGYAYIDWGTRRIIFPSATGNTPLSATSTYNFDYIAIPADITLVTSPVFPVAQDVLIYGMAADNDILQLSDKAKSYQKENEARYNDSLSRLAYWNAQVGFNN